MEHGNLGSVLLQLGDLDQAAVHLTESLRLARAGHPELMPYTMLGLAGLSARRGEAVAAGNLLGAVAAHLERHRQVLDPAEQLELASHLDAGRAAGDTFTTAYAAGRRIPLERLATRLP